MSAGAHPNEDFHRTALGLASFGWSFSSRRAALGHYSVSALGFSHQPCTGVGCVPQLRPASPSAFPGAALPCLAKASLQPAPPPLGFRYLLVPKLGTRVPDPFACSRGPTCNCAFHLDNNTDPLQACVLTLHPSLVYGGCYPGFSFGFYMCNCALHLGCITCTPVFSSPEVLGSVAAVAIVGAPKRYIGGSGVPAQLAQLASPGNFVASNLFYWLFLFGGSALSFGCSLLAGVFLVILHVLFYPRHAASPSKCIFRGFLPRGAFTLLLPFGCASPHQPVLDWRPPRRPCQHTHKPRPRALPWPVRFGVGLVHAIFGYHSLAFWPTPPYACLYVSAWTLCLPQARAMARPESAVEPEDLPPWDTMPRPLQTMTGTGPPVLPWADPGRAERQHAHFTIRDLPWTDTPSPADVRAQWLGVYVYTPHYQTVELAFPARRQDGVQPILDAVVDCAPGVPDRLFQCAVPVRPQRMPGFLHVLRYPSIIGGMSDGFAAVILDLTHVGGRYFATVLPSRLSYVYLLEFLLPFIAVHDGDHFVYIGTRTRPWPSVAEVTLRHGEVITVFNHAQTQLAWTTSADLFQGSQTWGPMVHFFRTETRTGLGVLYGDQRYSLDFRPAPGLTAEHVAVDSLRLDQARVVLCTFPTPDLDIQGVHCPTTVAVADRPIHPQGAQPVPRQDLFVYCDLRPLGMRPRYIRAHVPALHLPTLASDFGIHLPAAYKLGVVGGLCHRDMVRIQGNTTLVFFAEEADSDGSSSDTSVPAEPPPPQEHPSASDVDIAADHLPPSHAWETEFRDGTPHPRATFTVGSSVTLAPLLDSTNRQLPPQTALSTEIAPAATDLQHMGEWQAEVSYFQLENINGELWYDDAVTVVGTSCRHLAANVLTPRLKLHLQVIHAPSVGTYTVSEVRHFWSQRVSEVVGRPAGSDFILLCDANARLGSVASPHVGDKHADDENDAGLLFHEF